MKIKLPFSCKVQHFLGMLGIAIHNPFRNECTHDFGCCTNIGKYWLRINQEQKYKFIKPKSFKYDDALDSYSYPEEKKIKNIDVKNNNYGSKE